MRHSFEVSIAREYGVNAAILLEVIGYWVKFNEANRTNFHDGNYWTFGSNRAYRELFPYMSKRQIETTFEKLLSAGLIVKGNYNKDACDRTLWYTLTQEGKCILNFDTTDYSEAVNESFENVKCISSKCEMDSPKMGNAFPQNVKAIPFSNNRINITPMFLCNDTKLDNNITTLIDNNKSEIGDNINTYIPPNKSNKLNNKGTDNNINNNINNNIRSPKKGNRRESELTLVQKALFDRFWEIYPKKVAKRNAENAWKKINPTEELTSKIVQAVKDQLREDGRFKDTTFTPHPATWLNRHEWENSYEEERLDGRNDWKYFKPSTGFLTSFDD